MLDRNMEMRRKREKPEGAEMGIIYPKILVP
jgi:hypothetical protein